MRSANVTSFKGNKAHLPSKPCTVCGRDMVWRKAWARNWDEVKVCSERCRQDGRREVRRAKAGGGGSNNSSSHGGSQP
ncbi:DUF2256 domain-containing protein [Ideonella margarita]|uniref:DUF2256 domain-containing protein n=1 Tax=Ideonella margarita TaxID=2984191 RepID=A0ABU9C1Q9_9BURK